MPVYEVDINGKTYEFEGDSPPSEADIDAFAAGIGKNRAEGRQRTWMDALKQGIGNIPSSAVKTAAGMGEQFGAAAKFMSDPVYRAMKTPELPGLVANIPKALGQRYGSVEAIKQTLAEDPAGMALDVAGLAGGAGSLVRRGANVATKGAEHVYRSALKPTVALESRYPSKNIVRLGLDTGVSVTDKGLNKVTGLKEAAKRTRNQLVRQSTATVNPVHDIIRNPAVQDTARKVSQIGDVDASARTEFTGALRNYADAHSLRDPVTGQRVYRNYPVQRAELAKEHLNKVTSGQRGQVVTQGKKMANDAMRIAHKETVAAKVPGVAEQNAVMDNMIPLQQAIGRRLHVAGNVDAIPWRSWIVGTGAGATGGLLPGLLAGGAVKYGLSPASMSRFALGLDKVAKAGQASGRALPSGAYASLLARLMSSHEQP